METISEVMNELAPLEIPVDAVQDAQATVATTVGRGPIAIGPWSPKRIADAIASGNATRENLTERHFVDGIRTLVASDIAHDVNLFTLGAYYVTVEEIAAKDKEAFEAILCSLCESPLPESFESPEMKDGVAIRMVKVTPTIRQRLAHAVYYDNAPELVSTVSGQETLATKRVGNAVQKYKKVQSEQSNMLRLQREAEINEIMPGPDQTELGQAMAAKEKAAEANNDAEKSILPRSVSKLYVEMYRRARDPKDHQKTRENRLRLQNEFLAIGFPTETLAKWHETFMKGHGTAEFQANKAAVAGE